MNRIETPFLGNAGSHASDETFYCGTCKHSISVRGNSRKVVCVQTLALHEREDIASCAYAERKE